SRRRHTRSKRDWSSDVCSSDLDDDEFGDADGDNRRTDAVAFDPFADEDDNDDSEAAFTDPDNIAALIKDLGQLRDRNEKQSGDLDRKSVVSGKRRRVSRLRAT